LFADLDLLLNAIPHNEIAVQWDVAVEFAILEGGFEGTPGQTFDTIVERLARCVDRVPDDVPVGLHLCYGDYQHRHFKEPESLALQVDVANHVDNAAGRPVNWLAFTVPQYQRDVSFFTPLGDLDVNPETELYFALVPYHPSEQEPGTTSEQVRLVDAHLPTRDGGGSVEWGICTECGMARADRDDIPHLLDLHTEILAEHRA
jgi:methionine synthase II (cobalamin-independent)